jgi:hypothetical protein
MRSAVRTLVIPLRGWLGAAVKGEELGHQGHLAVVVTATLSEAFAPLLSTERQPLPKQQVRSGRQTGHHCLLD